MKSLIFTDHRTVVAEDLDEWNHVNNLQYLRWTLKAASAHSKDVGWTSTRYRALGAGWIVRSHKITYKLSAQLGDSITIRTWVADFDKYSSTRKYEIFIGTDLQRLCTVAETRWVFVDFATQKLVAIPDEVRIAFVPE
jgi:acyl-CoA thioester hydrolase